MKKDATEIKPQYSTTIRVIKKGKTVEEVKENGK